MKPTFGGFFFLLVRCRATLDIWRRTCQTTGCTRLSALFSGTPSTCVYIYIYTFKCLDCVCCIVLDVSDFWLHSSLSSLFQRYKSTRLVDSVMISPIYKGRLKYFFYVCHFSCAYEPGGSLDEGELDLASRNTAEEFCYLFCAVCSNARGVHTHN